MNAGDLPDTVTHPAHYCAGGVEPIDFIRPYRLEFSLGSVIKYVTRYRRKCSAIEDLQKARQYIAFARHRPTLRHTPATYGRLNNLGTLGTRVIQAVVAAHETDSGAHMHTQLDVADEALCLMIRDLQRDAEAEGDPE